MRINQNISAMSAYRALTSNQNALTTTTERLASGLRINRAADDAAGLAISERLRAQVGGLGQAHRNSVDGISLLQTAEGGLNETHAILQRMRTLAVQAGNGAVMGGDALNAIQAEMTQLTADIDRIATTTQFNGAPLLDGSFHDKKLQVGANAGDTQQVDITSGLSPATTAEAAAVALWDVYQPGNLSGTSGPVSVAQTVAGKTTSVNVPLSSNPASVTDLAAQLNANPDFRAAFTASTGSHTFANGTTVSDANLIITANEKGAGVITVSGIASNETRKQSRPGQDAKPETTGGFGSADLLGGPLDVTSGGGTGTFTSGGPTLGFGYANDSGTSSTTTVSWGSGASQALDAIDRAIAIVSRGRGDIGALQNGLGHTINSLGVASENMAGAESRIRDADMAKEVAEMHKRQIMSQATTAMLAQANQLPQNVLKLLG